MPPIYPHFKTRARGRKLTQASLIGAWETNESQSAQKQLGAQVTTPPVLYVLLTLRKILLDPAKCLPSKTNQLQLAKLGWCHTDTGGERSQGNDWLLGLHTKQGPSVLFPLYGQNAVLPQVFIKCLLVTMIENVSSNSPLVIKYFK